MLERHAGICERREGRDKKGNNKIKRELRKQEFKAVKKVRVRGRG